MGITRRSTEIGGISDQILLIKLAAPCQQIMFLFRTNLADLEDHGAIEHRLRNPPPDLLDEAHASWLVPHAKILSRPEQRIRGV